MQLKGELEKGGKDMIDMTNFKKSVKWYDENLASLLPQYRGKYDGVHTNTVDVSSDDWFGMGSLTNAPSTLSIRLLRTPAVE